MLTIKPKDNTITKTLRLSEHMVSRIEAIAKENNTTFTSVAEQCLEYALSNIKDSE